MRLMSIASGSSGNCIYVGSNNTHILIDLGISRKRIMEGLKEASLSLDDIDAAFITHEHIDHISGIPIVSKRNNINLYSSSETFSVIERKMGIKTNFPHLVNEIKKEETVVVGDLSVTPFLISHDAKEPFAYVINDGKNKISVATDLGTYDEKTVEFMKDSNAILLESNHDERMLRAGRYPLELQERILSERGHLSNTTAGQLCAKILNDNIKGIFLGHLSTDNNYDKLALETVKQEIDLANNKYKSSDFDINIVYKNVVSKIIEI